MADERNVKGKKKKVHKMRIPCPVVGCTFSTSNEEEMEKHRVDNHCPRCHLCNTVFTAKDRPERDLAEHMRTKHGPYYHCLVCGFKCKNPEKNVSRHYNNKHSWTNIPKRFSRTPSDPEKGWYCSVCSKKIGAQGKMKLHLHGSPDCYRGFAVTVPRTKKGSSSSPAMKKQLSDKGGRSSGTKSSKFGQSNFSGDFSHYTIPRRTTATLSIAPLVEPSWFSCNNCSSSIAFCASTEFCFG